MSSHNTTNHDQVNNSNISKMGVGKKTIVRVYKNRDFLQVSHSPLYDSRLSLKAKGILCIMLSMSDEWEFRREHLLTLCSDKKDGLTTGLQELRQFGYVTLNSERDSRGRIEQWVMKVYESPNLKDEELSTNGISAPSRSGKSASGESPIESRPVTDLSRSGFSRSGKSACNNINNNNINNNNSVVEKMIGRIPDLQLPEQVISDWITFHGEVYVSSKIDMLLANSKISNREGWLMKAIKNDYKQDPKEAPMTPASHEIWSPQLQERRNKAVEVLADSRDWRDIELEKMMEKLNAQI